MVARWMELVASHSSAVVRTILDIGCGTGRFAVPLAAHFSAPVVGVDPSAKMLAQARRDPCVHFVQGQGEHIPLRDRGVDLVFTSMAYHHFTQRSVVATECCRALQPGGSVFVRTGVRERMASCPYAPFFPTLFRLVSVAFRPPRRFGQSSSLQASAAPSSARSFSRWRRTG